MVDGIVQWILNKEHASMCMCVSVFLGRRLRVNEYFQPICCRCCVYLMDARKFEREVNMKYTVYKYSDCNNTLIKFFSSNKNLG